LLEGFLRRLLEVISLQVELQLGLAQQLVVERLIWNLLLTCRRVQCHLLGVTSRAALVLPRMAEQLPSNMMELLLMGH